MAHYALIWNVKPGSEDRVREIFANYEAPDPVVKDEDGNVEGQLISTQVFLKGNTVVRVMEVEGAFPKVAAHLGRQPSIQKIEAALDEIIENPRDMSNPQGAAQFFIETSMECLISRRLADPVGAGGS
jgi:hypothetical protein